MSQLGLQVSALPSGQGTLVRLSGRIDVFNFKDLSDQLREIVKDQVSAMAVDLTQIEFIASSGWATLMSVARSLRIRNGRLVAFGMNDEVMKVYEALNVETLLKHTADLDEAVKELSLAPGASGASLN